MALHETPGRSDEWYTPPYVFDALGATFDLDVASPGRLAVPWIPAARHNTAQAPNYPWIGFLWMNPPFGGRNGIVPWLDKFIAHSNGVCLVPDRTSAPWWQAWARHMDCILFVSPKIKFLDPSGQPGKSPAQGTCLGAMGELGIAALHRAQLAGLGVLLK